MPTSYYHYTSRVAAQLTIAAGAIRPGSGGVVYLTDDKYSGGAEAANQLAIPPAGPVALGVSLTKPAEVACIVPEDRLDPALIDGPDLVTQYLDPVTNVPLYLGGGCQFRYRGAINIAGLAWVELAAP